MEQPNLESIRLKEAFTLKEKKIKIECKTDIPIENLGKALDLTVFINGVKDKVTEGALELTAKATFNLIYINEGLKKTEIETEFTEVLNDKNLTQDKKVKSNFRIEKTGVEGQTTALFYAYVVIESTVMSEKTVECYLGDDDVAINTISTDYVKSYGERTFDYPVEEEFDLSYPVGEVLSHQGKVVITGVQCGVGTLIIDGEYLLSALFLQNDEKSDIIKIERSFPFRAETEYDSCMPSMHATSLSNVKSQNIDVIVDPETGKSIVKASAVISFISQAYSEETANITIDAFSVNNASEQTFEEHSFEQPDCFKTIKTKLGGRVETDAFEGTVIQAVAGETVEITEIKKADGGISIVGVLSVKCFIKSEDGTYSSRRLETPFEEYLAVDVCDIDRLQIYAVATKGGVRPVSYTEAEIGADVVFTLRSCVNKKIKYLKNLVLTTPKKRVDCAISVYIARKDEDLWSLSKRLNVHPEELEKTNPELQFPLTGDERIIIYRGK